MRVVPLFVPVARVVLFLALLVAPSGAAAHELPADVVIQVFVRPEGQRLRVVVRAPLAAMRDVSFPMRGPGFLELAQADAALRDAALLWLAGSIRVLEESAPLPEPALAAARVSLPSDRSFESYDAALAHLTAPPLPPDTEIVWNQALLDVLLEYPIRSDRSELALEPSFGRLGLRVSTAVRYLPADGGVRAFALHGDPGLLRLDPRWHQAALQFAESGFLHILEGIDHLLFLLCLVIPLRRVRPLVLVVSAFTLGHSVTLAGSAFGLAPDALWFPPLVELLIALSIVWMALENIVAAAAGRSVAERRWIMALAFGLVHGFGFSFALRDTLQFAGAHLLGALVSFNLGVELGQLAVLALVIPALHLFVRYAAVERVAIILLSALIAHTGWHWLLERGDRLLEYDIAWPDLDTALLVSVLRGAMLAVILAGLIWLRKSQKGSAHVATSGGADGDSARESDARSAGPAPSGVRRL